MPQRRTRCSYVLTSLTFLRVRRACSVPEIKLYTKDLVPNITYAPSDRVAILRKGGVMRVSDYGPGGVPAQLVLGLAWDVTNGVNIDLDASAILLDASLQQVDLVFFGKLGSSDGSIKHGGDEREGDEKVIAYAPRASRDRMRPVPPVTAYSCMRPVLLVIACAPCLS